MYMVDEFLCAETYDIYEDAIWNTYKLVDRWLGHPTKHKITHLLKCHITDAKTRRMFTVDSNPLKSILSSEIMSDI